MRHIFDGNEILLPSNNPSEGCYVWQHDRVELQIILQKYECNSNDYCSNNTLLILNSSYSLAYYRLKLHRY
jgi:hypothetical protein